jgi:hypothetical protein
VNTKHLQQLAEAPRGNSSARASPDDQAKYLKSQGRKRDQLMRQFLKGSADGARGNTREFLDGWDRIWGKKEQANG